MAVQIIPILRALAPLIANAGGVVASLRSSGAAAKMEDRVAQLERETLRAGEILTGVAQQLQAIVEALRVQAEQTEALRRRVLWLAILGLAALAVGLGALLVARAG